MSAATPVIFLGHGPLAPAPVFHELVRTSNEHLAATTSLRWWSVDTRCGRPLVHASWDARQQGSYRVADHPNLRFRLDHALLIGRPCGRCYPKGITTC